MSHLWERFIGPPILTITDRDIYNLFNGTNGLGDLGADTYEQCLTEVRSRSDDFVFKGMGINYSAAVKAVFSTTAGFMDNVRGLLSSQGYYDIQMSGDVGHITQSTLNISLRSSRDRGTLGEVQYNIRGALSSAGAQLIVNERIAGERPSPESICAPYKGQPGPGRNPEPYNPNPGGGADKNPPNPTKINMPALLIMGGLAVGAILLAKR